jgi:hypothetical protein
MPSSAQLKSSSDQSSTSLVIAACTAAVILSLDVASRSCEVVQQDMSPTVTVVTAIDSNSAPPIGTVQKLLKYVTGGQAIAPFDWVKLPTLSAPINQTQAFETADGPLADLVRSERGTAVIGSDFISTADTAVSDALTFAGRLQFPKLPVAMLSDDGVLTLQWRREGYGAALIFAGDAEVSIAFNRPGQRYTENGIEISIHDELPHEFLEAMTIILEG